MLRVAFRNLFQNKIRFAISVCGAGLALTLILALDAIMVGSERQLTAYIDNAGADIWVSQPGVRNMHMASSSLPGEVVDRIRATDKVESATPILYLTNMVVAGDDEYLAYIIGVPSDAEVGGAWRVTKGDRVPQPGEAVIDRRVAAKAGVGMGDVVRILGKDLRVSGLSAGTTTLVNSVAFISLDDFTAARGGDDAVSFVLVNGASGARPDDVAARISAQVPGVTVQTRQEFADEERRVIKDMLTDLITIMNLAGFLIGLAVIALTIYVATFARRKEYGILRALGARNADLYRVVLAQALGSVTLGFIAGLVFTFALTVVVPRMGTDMELAVSIRSLVKVSLLSSVIAGLAAVLPIKQIAGLDPAVVFRGGGTR